MTQAYSLLLDTVRQTRQAWQMRRVAEAGLLVVASALAALTAAVLIDLLLAPPGWGRWVLGFTPWAAASFVVWRWLVPVLSIRRGTDHFAALLEARLQSLRNRFINAIQLGRDEAGQPPALIASIVNDGVAAVENLDIGRALSSPRLRQSATGAVAAAIGAVAVFLTGPAAVTSFARVLAPWSSIPPFTYTRVTLTEPTASVEVLEGEPLRIRARTSGESTQTAELVWRVAGQPPRTAAMRMTGPDAFEHTLDAVHESGACFVRAGDGRSGEISVTVIPRPRVAAMSVVYDYPAYLRRDPTSPGRFDGHLSAVARTKATLTIGVSKPLDALTLDLQDGRRIAASRDGESLQWTASMLMDKAGAYRVRMIDPRGHEVLDPVTYAIALEHDAPPAVAIVQPGRDVQLRTGQTLDIAVAAQDDHGLAWTRLRARSAGAGGEPRVLAQWPERDPRPRGEYRQAFSVEQLGLQAGERLEYWAEAIDHNDLPDVGPGRGESRRFTVTLINPSAADALVAMQLSDYAKVIEQLIRLQRLNRAETAQLSLAAALIERQTALRQRTIELAETMRRNGFPARTIIDDLDRLGRSAMARVIVGLEAMRDAADLAGQRSRAEATLPTQDAIIAELESILERLSRGEQVRQTLRKLERTDPAAHRRTLDAAAQLAVDLDSFLVDMKELDDRFEKMAKRGDDNVAGDALDALQAAEHRLDRWGKWARDTVDEILKLPEGFVKDSMLADSVNTIFEEIEKKQRSQTREIATPVEEGAKSLATEMLEDLEMWMPDAGDSTKWTMEDPLEGRYEVPETKLPDHLQDMVGDLIEDLEEFDEEADDITGGWGGNFQVGWDIGDGPISSFAAVGKTGNQMPNASEMGGRSGAGRRGRSSGQMVGSESSAMEGRPTPARLTNEPYETGQVDASKQLDPRGATGGGRKTGGGTRGLQGGTSPDLVKEMQRLADKQKLLREQSQNIARQLDHAGRPSSSIDRAAALLQSAEALMADQRYEDAARVRKESIVELRAAASQLDQVVTLTMQRARDLPPELREQIIDGSRLAMPEGYEDMVGEYFKTLAGDRGP